MNSEQATDIDHVLAEYISGGQEQLDNLPVFLQHYSDRQLICFGAGLECLVAVVGGSADHRLLKGVYSEIRSRANLN